MATVGLLLAASAARGGEPTQLRFGTLWYLSAQETKQADARSSEFLVKRGHLDLFLDFGTSWTARVTPDVTVDAAGDLHAPAKFAYLEWHRPRLGPLLRSTFVQVGRVPTPWIGFEEGIDRYRMQDGTFMDRLGFFASADEGVAVGALLGEGLPSTFLEQVHPPGLGRWGSIALGVYSGSGFNAPDRNDEPVVQGRLTIRPAPDSLPGAQLSFLGVDGAGNTAAAPRWSVTALMASFEARHTAATLQWTENAGAQSGAWVDAAGRSLRGRGWSAFVELREGPGPGWAGFVRHDWFDRDRERPGARSTRSIAALGRHFPGGSAVLLDYEVEHFEEASRPDARRLQLTVQLKISPRPVGEILASGKAR